MKNKVWMLVFLSACAGEDKPISQEIAADSSEPVEWIVYEGIVKSETGRDIKMELKLSQSTVGLESDYKTSEEYIASLDNRLMTTRSGKYTILYGSSDEMVITLGESKGSYFVWQGDQYTIGSKNPGEETHRNARVGKLAFRTGRNSDELVLLDQNSNPVSETQYVLRKRSMLFTVEGFVTVSPDETELYEFNTWETWNVIKSGVYDEVQIKYIELAREKNEGIYLKAVAFYVNDTDSTGADVKNLVIKRIVAMKSHQQFKDSYIREQ